MAATEKRRVGRMNIPVASETNVRTGTARFRVSLPRTIGYGVFVSWFTIMVWSSTFFPPAMFSTLEEHILRLGLILGTAFGMLIIAVLGRRHASKKRTERFSNIALSLCAVALMSLACIALLLPFIPALVLWSLAGVGNAALLSLWNKNFTALNQKQLIFTFSTGFALAGAIFLLSGALQEELRAPFAASLPIISLLLYAVSPQKVDRANAESSYRSMIDSHPDGDSYYERERLLSVLSNVFIGFLISCATSDIFSFGTFVSLGVALISSGVLMVTLLFAYHKSLSFQAFGALLPVATLLLLAFAFAPEPFRSISLAAMVFVFTSFSVLNVSKLVWCSRFLPERRLSTLASCRASSRFAFAGGFAFGYFAIVLCEYYPPALIFASFALLCALSIIAFERVYGIRSNDRDSQRDGKARLEDAAASDQTARDEEKAASSKDAEDLSPAPGPLETAVQTLSRTYGLSGRETDVATLLAKGRNASYIAAALYIAPNTVKTHMGNLYGKLDIHSQQELIDLVEAQVAEDRHNDAGRALPS